jgi:hypothetical protein
MIQTRNFPYDLYYYLIPTGYLIYLWRTQLNPRLIVLGMLAIWSVGLLPGGYREKLEIEDKNIKASLFIIREKIKTEDKILYLSSGDTAYHLGIQSECEQFEPQAIQRREKMVAFNGPMFNEQLKCVLNYAGKFIIYESTWFETRYLPKVAAKLENEYQISITSQEFNRKFILFERKND